jgi:hypothetical protein
MEKLIAIIAAVALALVGVVCVSFLLSWPVYMLWNECLVGAVRGVNQVSWLQAWGIMVLFGILFKETSVSFSK